MRALQVAVAAVRPDPAASRAESAVEARRARARDGRASPVIGHRARAARRCRRSATRRPRRRRRSTFGYRGNDRRARSVRAAAARRVLVRRRARSRRTTSCARTASIASRATSPSSDGRRRSSGPPASTCATAFPVDPKELGAGGADGASPSCAVDAARAGGVVRELGSERVVRRHADGAVDVEVPCANVAAFRSWVLGLLDHAEVLGAAGRAARRSSTGCARWRAP